MSFKHTIRLKKIKASFLLLVLFAVTIIQVSHSHAVANRNLHEKTAIQKSGLSVFGTAMAESKCFICEYQLTKDADAIYSSFRFSEIFIPVAPVVFKHSYLIAGTHIAFENRGPPSA